MVVGDLAGRPTYGCIFKWYLHQGSSSVGTANEVGPWNFGSNRTVGAAGPRKQAARCSKLSQSARALTGTVVRVNIGVEIHGFWALASTKPVRPFMKAAAQSPPTLNERHQNAFRVEWKISLSQRANVSMADSKLSQASASYLRHPRW